MTLLEAEIGKKYEIVDVPPKDPCQLCRPCARLRMMEIGFDAGEVLIPVKRQGGVWVVELEGSMSRVALRDDEAERIIVKKL